jgi:hypothetical protein
MTSRPKRPRDPNQLAKMIVDLSTGDADDIQTDNTSKKNPAAVALGRLGGLKGGAARAAALSPRKRKLIAKRAAAKRWATK